MNIFKRQELLRKKRPSRDYLYLLFQDFILENDKVTLLNADALKRRFGKTHLLSQISFERNYPIIVKMRTHARNHTNEIVVCGPDSLRGNKHSVVLVEEGFTLEEIHHWILPYVDRIEMGYYIEKTVNSAFI